MENTNNKNFSKENLDDLKIICQRIISLTDENVDGELMMSQKLMLGENIKKFVNNPIVKNSGII